MSLRFIRAAIWSVTLAAPPALAQLHKIAMEMATDPWAYKSVDTSVAGSASRILVATRGYPETV